VTSITAHPTLNRAGDAVFPGRKSVSPDGKHLILDVGIFMGPKYFQVLSTDSLNIVHETRIPDWRLHHDHAWHPDGKRVFLSFRGGFDLPMVGGVDVYDVSTNSLQYYITADEISIDQEILQPRYIPFTPDGHKMAILNAEGSIPAGSILVFDVATKLLIRRIVTPVQGYSYAMALIPIDWEKEERK
jgi:hypothetical protein